MASNTVEPVAEKYTLPNTGAVQHFALGRNVVLHSADDDPYQRERDSTHANTQVICEYKWDPKTKYDGRIISTRDNLIAYRIFNEQTGEAIRVMERETRQRILIRDFAYPIVDQQYAFHAPLLAVLDNKANLHVYHVNENGKEVSKYQIIHRDVDKNLSGAAKIVWCPYMEDPNQGTHIVAICQGSIVDIYYLHAIKQHFGQTEVNLSQVLECPEAHVRIHVESEITAVRISPDATACAVTTISGEFIFYVIENYKSRVAHTVRPLPKFHVNEILFLDNFVRHEQNTDDPYWKYVLLVSDDGRRLGIYSCYNWDCVAKLRFESAVQASRLEVVIDPSARFVCLTDYEGSNLFCLELAPAFPSLQPYFVGCAQICFSQRLIALSLCSIEEIPADTEDLLQDDDEVNANRVNITFSAVTSRSLVELTVDVEKGLELDLNESPERGAKIIQEKLAHQTRQLMLSNRCLSIGTGSNETDGSLFSKKDSSSRRSVQDDSRMGLSDASNITSPTVTVLTEANAQILHELKKTRQVLQEMTEKSELSEKRMDEVDIQLEKLLKDNADLRREQTDNLADVLEKICNEIRLRDEHIEQLVKRMNTDLRGDVKRIVEQTLNDNAVSLQSTMEVSNTRVVETVKSVLGQVLVPALEGMCTQLFVQMNNQFREGIQEFIEQMKKTQSQAVTPSVPDYTTLSQFIEQGRYDQAFEAALTRNDYTALIYVCTKINPETAFSECQATLSPQILHHLLLNLGHTFEQDTELKLNYLENIVMSLSGVSHLESFRPTLHNISKNLLAFISNDQNGRFKRQGRIVNQLISTLK